MELITLVGRFKQTFRFDGEVQLGRDGCLATSRCLEGSILRPGGTIVGKSLRGQHTVHHGGHSIHLGGNACMELSLEIGKDGLRDEVAERHGFFVLLLVA